MRNLFSLLCLLLAGLASVAGLAGYQLNELLRSEEPVAQIAGTLPAQQDFSQAVTEAMIDDLTSRLPGQLQSFVPGGVDQVAAPLVSAALNNDRTLAAWEEVLQQTRTDYTAQLEQIFAEGTSGDLRELDIELDLTPVTEAMTQPLREGLDDALGWIHGVEPESFDVIAPEISIDIQAATENTADPYTWATAAAASRYWPALTLAAAALAVLGLMLGTRRLRWYALASGAVLAAALGMWIATTYASPDFHHPPGVPETAAVILDHLQAEFTAWAQPAWWVFSVISGVVVLIGVAVALLTPSRYRGSAQVLTQR
ncbi:hypothetical protein [Nesterenkonia muleiensis]|uniref:hypothetical protein n=1 Tax=Nesterenkonia muleiensis TaxID=2282648 RepID=UPI000E727A73|nr:hypothetical protein [Nesterenkonia muleiensis]